MRGRRGDMRFGTEDLAPLEAGQSVPRPGGSAVRPRVRGRPKLAHGQGTGRGSWRPGKGTGPLEAGARGRDGASEAGARGKGRGRLKLAPGKGRGRLGHGPGRLWPCPRRPGVRVEEEGRRCAGGGTEACREDDGSGRDRDEIPPREGDAGNVTLSPEFLRRHEHVTTLRPPYGVAIHAARPGGPKRALRGPEGVTFPASSSRPALLDPGSMRNPHGSPTSLRASVTSPRTPRCRPCAAPCRPRPDRAVPAPQPCRPCASFPTKPLRPGRLVAATACPGRHETPGTHLGRPRRPRTTPGRTSDGRAGREPHRDATRTAAPVTDRGRPPPGAPWDYI